jgi:hypothetical protein
VNQDDGLPNAHSAHNWANRKIEEPYTEIDYLHTITLKINSYKNKRELYA